MNNGNDLGLALGAIVTIVGGFGVIAKLMLSQASNDRTSDRDERIRLAEAISQMAENSARVADEAVLSRKVQEKGFNEAKQRNGHLADLVIQTSNKTMETIQTIGQQTISEQKIEHQVINNKESV